MTRQSLDRGVAIGRDTPDSDYYWYLSELLYRVTDMASPVIDLSKEDLVVPSSLSEICRMQLLRNTLTVKMSASSSLV